MKKLSKLAKRAPRRKPRIGRSTFWTTDLLQTVETLRSKGHSWRDTFDWLRDNGYRQFANYESLRGSYNSRK